MKLENSYGSVQLICSKKEKSKRRNPYRVRITVGWTDEGTQLYDTLGYAPTRKAGQQMLAEYHNEPYNLEMHNFTFNDLYEQWHEWKITTNLSKRTKDKLKSHRKHYDPIQNKLFTEINLNDLQTIVNKSDCTHDYQQKIIRIYKQMHKFAKAKNMKVGNDISVLVTYTPYVKPTLHQPYTDEQIDLQWEHQDNIIIAMNLVNIYSGIRPGEFFVITEVHENYFITGSKTEAGLNRVIPLNNKIIKLFHRVYNSGILEKIGNEDTYYHRFKKEMTKIGLDNTPYSARHTFATLMDRADAKDFITKIIMGHEVDDITKDTYTHKRIDELIAEVNKI